ncbi:MAG: bifunctional adenosylcobinamide kinase/adenosylcobinamide-phosphate guanylyltransferase [Peptococcaceae bacterium]|nr:bifunctional adenosylcobinamide kinase/adenosylcobinamide-phosphate guanylyltransferase [Peptococcaceae bacterium]
MGELTLVLGGSGSGKSEVAERMAASHGEPVIYLATAAAGDREMAGRIERHRSRRPSGWSTVEESRALALAVEREGKKGGVLLLEDLTTWLANLLSGGDAEDVVLREVENLLAAVDRVPARIIMVACEVGCGLVPVYPLGRAFRDVSGRANQMAAARAGRVYLVVAALPLTLK